MPESGDIQSPIEAVVGLLDRHGVEYVIIGGMAAVLHGALRPTYDVDICYRRTPQNLDRLASALREVHPTLRGAPGGLPFTADARTLEHGSNFTLDTDAGPLDLLGWVEPIGDFEHVAAQSDVVPFGPRRLLVLSITALIRVKRHLGRPKDQAAIDELLAIQRLRSPPA